MADQTIGARHEDRPGVRMPLIATSSRNEFWQEGRLRRSRKDIAAVGRECLADVVVAVGGSQQHGGRRDLARQAQPRERQLTELPFLPFGRQRRAHFGVDQSRRNRIDEDAVRCEFRGKRARKADDSRFGRAIVHETGRPLVGELRGDVDDPAPTARAHARRRELRKLKQRAEGYIQRRSNIASVIFSNNTKLNEQGKNITRIARIRLARAADAVILVARSGQTPYNVAQRAQSAFANSRRLGFVLNAVRETTKSGAYYYYGKRDASRTHGRKD